MKNNSFVIPQKYLAYCLIMHAIAISHTKRGAQTSASSYPERNNIEQQHRVPCLENSQSRWSWWNLTSSPHQDGLMLLPPLRKGIISGQAFKRLRNAKTSIDHRKSRIFLVLFFLLFRHKISEFRINCFKFTQYSAKISRLIFINLLLFVSH